MKYLIISAVMLLSLSSFEQSNPSYVVKATPDAVGRYVFDVCEKTENELQNCLKLTEQAYDVNDLQKLRDQTDQELRKELDAIKSKQNLKNLSAGQKAKIAGVIVGVIALSVVVAGGAAGLIGFASLVGVEISPALVAGVAFVGSLAIGGANVAEVVSAERAKASGNFDQAAAASIKNYEYMKAMANLLTEMNLPADAQTRRAMILQLQDSLKTLPATPREGVINVPGKLG